MVVIINLLKSKELKTGYLYFYIHFIVEVVCFFFLSRITNNSYYVWLVPFIYDGIAFVPQSIIGYIFDKHPKINIGIIGVILLLIAYILYSLTNISIFISLIILCLGNAFLHVSGAEVTIKSSNGKLSPSAIFVAGGSFGVVTGKLLSKSMINPIFLIIPILTMIPFILLSNKYVEKKAKCEKFNYVNEKISSKLVILTSVLIVMIRGYMGYGIPTSWNKTVFQTILLFSIMGIGKALGGILSDLFGIKKIAIFSTLISIPFLCFGDKMMIISLIGVMFFSMTMSITLSMVVSKLKDSVGLAFGLTTIGLFLGTVPIFFIKLDMIYNIIVIVFFSLFCAYLFKNILKEDEKV